MPRLIVVLYHICYDTAVGSTPLTLLQPETDVLLAGVDGVHSLGTHIAEVGAQQAPLAEVDGDVHVQVLQAPHLLRLTHCPRVFLCGGEEFPNAPLAFPLITEGRQAQAGCL